MFANASNERGEMRRIVQRASSHKQPSCTPLMQHRNAHSSKRVSVHSHLWQAIALHFKRRGTVEDSIEIHLDGGTIAASEVTLDCF